MNAFLCVPASGYYKIGKPDANRLQSLPHGMHDFMYDLGLGPPEGVEHYNIMYHELYKHEYPVISLQF